MRGLEGSKTDMPACAGMRLRQPRPELASDGVGGLVVLDQRTKRVDEVFDLQLFASGGDQTSA